MRCVRVPVRVHACVYVCLFLGFPHHKLLHGDPADKVN